MPMTRQHLSGELTVRRHDSLGMSAPGGSISIFFVPVKQMWSVCTALLTSGSTDNLHLLLVLLVNFPSIGRANTTVSLVGMYYSVNVGRQTHPIYYKDDSVAAADGAHDREAPRARLIIICCG